MKKQNIKTRSNMIQHVQAIKAQNVFNFKTICCYFNNLITVCMHSKKDPILEWRWYEKWVFYNNNNNEKMQQDMTQHRGKRSTRKAPKKNKIIITMKNPQPWNNKDIIIIIRFYVCVCVRSVLVNWNGDIMIIIISKKSIYSLFLWVS